MFKTVTDLGNGQCLYHFRVYERAGQTSRTYVAKIVGTDPNYILGREFRERRRVKCRGFDPISYVLDEGIYEQVIKRFEKTTGNYISKERKWLVVYGGEIRRYSDNDMNYQYVLYSAFNLLPQRRAAI